MMLVVNLMVYLAMLTPAFDEVGTVPTTNDPAGTSAVHDYKTEWNLKDKLPSKEFDFTTVHDTDNYVNTGEGSDGNGSWHFDVPFKFAADGTVSSTHTFDISTTMQSAYGSRPSLLAGTCKNAFDTYLKSKVWALCALLITWKFCWSIVEVIRQC